MTIVSAFDNNRDKPHHATAQYLQYTVYSVLEVELQTSKYTPPLFVDCGL